MKRELLPIEYPPRLAKLKAAVQEFVASIGDEGSSRLLIVAHEGPVVLVGVGGRPDQIVDDLLSALRYAEAAGGPSVPTMVGAIFARSLKEPNESA